MISRDNTANNTSVSTGRRTLLTERMRFSLRIDFHAKKMNESAGYETTNQTTSDTFHEITAARAPLTWITVPETESPTSTFVTINLGGI
jgi:hypothetical protein